MYLFFSVDYLDHAVVFILSTAVVSVQVDRPLSTSVVFQEVVEETDNSVRTLACHYSLVNEVVYLL